MMMVVVWLSSLRHPDYAAYCLFHFSHLLEAVVLEHWIKASCLKLTDLMPSSGQHTGDHLTEAGAVSQNALLLRSPCSPAVVFPMSGKGENTWILLPEGLDKQNSHGATVFFFIPEVIWKGSLSVLISCLWIFMVVVKSKFEFWKSFEVQQ